MGLTMEFDKPLEAAYRFDRFTLDLTRGTLLSRRDGVAPAPQIVLAPATPRTKRRALVGSRYDHERSLAGHFRHRRFVTQCVHDIRRAFGDEAQNLLRTVPRRGYLFSASVSRLGVSEQAIEPGPPDNVPSTAASPTAPVESPRQPDQTEGQPLLFTPGAERRHLSVLFCDLADSTVLTDQLEPEDVDAVMRSYRARCAAA